VQPGFHIDTNFQNRHAFGTRYHRAGALSGFMEGSNKMTSIYVRTALKRSGRTEVSWAMTNALEQPLKDSFRKANTRRSTPCRLLGYQPCGKGFR
jgi:hypothetical protein